VRDRKKGANFPIGLSKLSLLFFSLELVLFRSPTTHRLDERLEARAATDAREVDARDCMVCS